MVSRGGEFNHAGLLTPRFSLRSGDCPCEAGVSVGNMHFVFISFRLLW